MLIKLAWRNLWRNRRRTLITMASVFFAVMLAIIMNSLQTGAYDNMINNIVSFYSGYIQVHQQEYWEEQTLENSFETSDELTQTIAEHPDVTFVVPRLESFALASSTNLTRGCMVVGIDPETENQLTNLEEKVYEGSYLQKDQIAALMAEELADKLDLGVGDTLIVLGQGYHGVSAAGKYPIQGLVSFGSPELNERLVYLPLEEARYLYGAYSRLTSLALDIDQPGLTAKVVRDLQQQLDTSQYEVLGWREMMPDLVQMMKMDKAGNVITIAILYMIIAFGIFGTVLMMIAERRHEFGIMISIGMKKARLAGMVAWELLFISMLGVLGGMAFSLPIVLYFNLNPINLGEEAQKAYESFGVEALLPASLDPAIFITEGITVLIVTLLIIIYPVWKINNLDPLEAMRS